MILGKNKVREIRNFYQNFLRGTGGDSQTIEDWNSIVSLAETCLAAMASAEEKSKALAGIPCMGLEPAKSLIAWGAKEKPEWPGAITKIVIDMRVKPCGECSTCRERARRKGVKKP
jgi:hypothetical protein